MDIQRIEPDYKLLWYTAQVWLEAKYPVTYKEMMDAIMNVSLVSQVRWVVPESTKVLEY